jgi:hypothetical protein
LQVVSRRKCGVWDTNSGLLDTLSDGKC